MPPEEAGLIHINPAAKDMAELDCFAESVTKTFRRSLESWKAVQGWGSSFAGLAGADIQLRCKILPCVRKRSDDSLFDL